MEPTATSPYWITGFGILLAFLGYRAIITKKAWTAAGSKTSKEAGYYIIVAGYIIGALALFIWAGSQLRQLYGITAVSLFILSLGVLGFVVHKFRALARGLLLKIKYLVVPKPKPPGPSPRSWAMASVAFLSKTSGKDFYLLGGAEPSERRQKWATRKLKRDWEVLDEEDFDEIQEWLFETGHRVEFRELIDKVRPMTPEERDNFKQGTLAEMTDRIDREEFEHRMEMIEENIEDIRNNGFMAWDLLRFIDFCRLGYLAEYMPEEEAWERILSAAQVLQSRFDSWTEMMDNYFLGREFWSIVETQKDTKTYQKAYQKLQNDKKSPWNRIPWESPLYRPESSD